jgi:integrase
VAADLLSQQCWSGNTWATRSSQWRKWEGFCEQDERSIFPASEGDVLAYIGFLRLEGSVSAASLPQYLSAVSRYHELAGVASPTKTTLVRSLVQAYSRAFDLGAVARPTRVGLSAAVMRRILVLGLQTPVPALVRDAALVMFMFLFGCRASTAVSVRGSDLDVTDARMTAVLVHRKGKRTQDPLVLDYDRNPAVGFASSPLALLRRWTSMRPTSDVFFALAEEEDLCATTATHAIAALMSALPPSVVVPTGCTYSSHSARIGAYNEWLALSFPTPWIMHRMGWESEGMLRVYYDPRIAVTDDSGWFFAHMRPRI